MNIDLKKVVYSYPDSLRSRARVRSIMQDLYPDQVREMNVLLAVYESGILKQMVADRIFTVERQARYVQRIQDDYGIKKPIIPSAVRAWMDICKETDLKTRFKGSSPLVIQDSSETGESAYHVKHEMAAAKPASWTPPEIVGYPEDVDETYDIGITAGGQAIILGTKADNLTDAWIPPMIDGRQVVGINEGAFQYSSAIRRAVIPEGVKYIGEEAFGSCNSLTQLELPHSLKWIGRRAFAYTKLCDVRLPDALTVIADGTFYWCTDLRTIHLPAKLTKIDMDAFFGCQSLEMLEIPALVTEIGRQAFYNGKSLRQVKIRGPQPSIGEEAFGRCPLLFGFEHIGSQEKREEFRRWQN